MDLVKIAAALYAAEQNREPIEQLSKTWPALTLDDAYAVQKLNVDKKLADGAVVTGKKIGLTSLAMQQSLGVDQPDYGILLDTMEVKGGRMQADELLQPRVEGELVFILDKDLGPDPDDDELKEACRLVVPAIEVVASRIRDWKLTIVDTVADNASCGKYLLGPAPFETASLDLKAVQMKLYRNGKLVNEGVGAAVLGDPLRAVRWLAASLARYGVTLNRGDIILSGALSAAVPAEEGDVFTFDFGPLGSLELQFT